MSETFIFTFNDETSYEKYKREVTDNGGVIKDDLGKTLLGFTAIISPTLVQSIRSSSLAGNGINTFEPDSVVKIQ